MKKLNKASAESDVTPEMLSAGAAVLRELGESYDEFSLAGAVYSAMAKLSCPPSRQRHRQTKVSSR